MSLQTKPLSFFVQFYSGGTPSKQNAAYWGGEISWLTPKDMSSFDGTTQYHVTEAAIGNGTKLAPRESLFIAIRGMSLHNEIRIVRPMKAISFNQDIKAVVPNENADDQFIYYALQAKKPELLCFVESAGHGTGRLPTDKLKSLDIPDLPLSEQRAIASVLGALDDKIELNRRMNETLEAMARAIFRDWFVDFGPTRARMDGRAPYLAPEIWSLFPDRLDADGKPEGWETSAIGDEVVVVGGSTPSTKEPAFWDGDIPWATPKDLSNLSTPVLLETGRRITQAGLAKISSGLLPRGTVLLSSRAPIGYLAISEVLVAVNQGFIAMVCDARISNVFTWLWASENMDAILQNANGSTFQEISKRNFRPLPLIIGSLPLLQAFDAIAGPLYERIAENEKECRTLAETRDLLLPKLMSGEIRVRDAEQIVEDVA